MKNVFLILVAILGVGSTTITAAHKQEPIREESLRRDTVDLRKGLQKTVARGELKIKFVAVLEDSRCPLGVNCVWAGNAKIQLRVTDRRGRTKLMELNTGGEPRGDRIGRYAINLVNLTPLPKPNEKFGQSRYTARLSIQRLDR